VVLSTAVPSVVEGRVSMAMVSPAVLAPPPSLPPLQAATRRPATRRVTGNNREKRIPKVWQTLPHKWRQLGVTDVVQIADRLRSGT
jgi:hypothetical protein